jgi:hypothetical protein
MRHLTSLLQTKRKANKPTIHRSGIGQEKKQQDSCTDDEYDAVLLHMNTLKMSRRE